MVHKYKDDIDPFCPVNGIFTGDLEGGSQVRASSQKPLTRTLRMLHTSAGQDRSKKHSNTLNGIAIYYESLACLFPWELMPVKGELSMFFITRYFTLRFIF